MEKVTFEVETITPLFLAGNDQIERDVTQKEENDIIKTFKDWHIRAEIRAASFRGLMRYWERALVGGVLQTLDEVRQYEQKLFGATDCGSVITVRVTQPTETAQIYQKEKAEKKYPDEVKNGIYGRNYLFWSMDKSGKKFKSNFKAARFYYPDGTTFKVTLSIHGHEDKEKLEQAVVTLWLLTQLGGIGSRSRRCAGSLTAKVSSDKRQYKLPEKLLSLFEPTDTPEALQKQLEEGIKFARELYGFKEGASGLPQKFDVLAKGACRIWVLHDGWKTVNEAMGVIGKSLQDYRRSITTTNGIYALMRRKVFGLPIIGFIPPQFRQFQEELEKSRRSSPLMLKVTKLTNGEFVVVAVLFETLDSDGSRPDYNLIQDWILYRFSYSQRLEVAL